MGDSQILGLDIGANSVGWALLDCEGDRPIAIIACGARAFDAGVDGSLEQGREESLHTERRDARQRRRQTMRQSQRMLQVARVLQQPGLLPDDDVSHGSARHTMFCELDKRMYEQLARQSANGHDLAHKLPYALRARALDEALEPYALGRSLYHLAVRRGFLSNRESDAKDEETGKVKSAISELSGEMERSGARTLGEFLASLDPVQERRIRQRWTARSMYEQEFEAIWAAQQPHHSDVLTEDLKRNLKQAIFYQRPLKSQKGLIGRCSLEPGKRRASMALPIAQRFRILQKVNDLVIEFDDGTKRSLNAEERAILTAQLEEQEEMNFGKIRTLLKLPKTSKFNLEEGGEKKLKGNVTSARLRKIFGVRWDELEESQRRQLVSEVLGCTKEETLRRRGEEVWGLNAEEAARFAKVQLDRKYTGHSTKALKKIVPLMEEGLSYAEAKKKTYHEEDGRWKKLVCDALPPVEDSDIELRNPAVMRALTEVRKVVNHLVKSYGKPDRIRIELARDLRRPKSEREKLWKRNRERQKERDAARKALQDRGVPNPSRSDIEKYLLAQECGWQCPFTGSPISFGALFGAEPQFDVEHIWPFSRTLDDSYLNKTLCHHEENRNRKGNRTPYEVYARTEAWPAILDRVADFQGDAAKEKLRRFTADSIPDLDDFSSRQLNDTRYTSRLASRYLGLLYGEEALRRVEVSTGQATSYLRGAWELNRILGDGHGKSRDDHRHHAVDAIVTALIDRSMVKRMSLAAQRQVDEKGRSRGWWNRVEEPWEGFVDDVEEKIASVITSHRVNRRVRGRLHEDTNYAPPRTDDNGETYVAVRKPLGPNFSPADASKIIDPTLRRVVAAYLEEYGNDPKKAFADGQPFPRLTNGLRVRRARIKSKTPVFPVGKGHRTRLVASDTNHHVEIVEEIDKKGRKKWSGVVVSLYEAHRRAYGRIPRPVIQRDHGEGKRFVFSLGLGECIEMDDTEGIRRLYRVRGMSKFTNGTVQLSFQLLNDARPISKVPKEGRTRTPNKMLDSNARKVTVSPSGDVLPAND